MRGAADDGKLVRMGAMNQMNLLNIVQTLERGGMKGVCRRNGREHWLDFCVVDRCSGPTLACSWIEVDLDEGTATYVTCNE